jgi:hypothetical protein
VTIPLIKFDHRADHPITMSRYYNGMEGLGKDPGPDETDGFDMRKSMPRDAVCDRLSDRA